MKKFFHYPFSALVGLSIVVGFLAIGLGYGELSLSFFPNGIPGVGRIPFELFGIAFSGWLFYLLNQKIPLEVSHNRNTIILGVIGIASLLVILFFLRLGWDVLFPREMPKFHVNRSSSQIKVYFGMIMLGPIYEEILFRGVILRIIKKISSNTYFSIITSAILFGLLHVNWFDPNRDYFPMLSAFIFGGIMGLVWEETKSIYLCILYHVEYNFLVLLFH